MTGISRDTSGDLAGQFFDGTAAFWAGEAFSPKADSTWQEGWLSAAGLARQRAEYAAPFAEQRERIITTLNESYAALKRASELPKLMPGTRSLINSALVHTNSLLAHLAPTPAKSPTQPSGGSSNRNSAA